MALPVKDKNNTETQDPLKRRPNRAALLLGLLTLLAVLAAALTLPGLWRETQRREAFLPTLEAEAARTPDDGRLLALVGARRMEAGEYVGAADALRQAIAAGEQNEILWRELAANVAASGDRARAQGDLRLGLKTFPNSVNLQGALAQTRVLGRDAPPGALARAIAPEGPAPLLREYAAGSRLNGFATWWGRRHSEASGFSTRETWAQERPDDAQAQRLWGMALLKNRRLPEAQVALSHAVALSPRSPEANLALADLLDEERLPAKAVGAYVVCLKLHPDWLPALLGLGQAALNADLPAYAVPAYQRATQIEPNSAEAWIGLGRAASSEPDFIGLAVTAFQTATRLAPDRTDFYTDYAATLRKAGLLNTGVNSHMPEAAALLRRRIASVPDDFWAHYLLANVLLHGPPSPTAESVAEAETRKALELAPGDPLSEIQLAHILLDRNDFPHAIDLLTKALAVSPDNAPATRTLAQAYSRSGRSDLAKKAFAQAQALTDTSYRIKVLRGSEKSQPLSPKIHRELALLYLRQGKQGQADAERNMADLIQKNPQAAAVQLNAVKTLIQTVLKPR